ncbi:uncharacterized protein LOC120118835 [Hibiscus syriacus]|uniref:uncharacterized protein LOC120118835 n=1 Tax=Hibiscus syriacus TaxID=106335 RepID=UPI00192050CD|nr:uncharacterized protein LOC120118835 [Hibiscus syriacus]
MGPYEVLKRVESVAYRLVLPPELKCFHNVVYVSMLRRYRSDPSHIILLEKIKVSQAMNYKEEPIRILARDVKELQNKKIILLKVLWRNHGVKEVTWEIEDDIQL